MVPPLQTSPHGEASIRLAALDVFRRPGAVSFTLMLIWVAILSACAHIDHHYARMTFDEFIDEQDLGADLKDDAIRKRAYRAKWSAANYQPADDLPTRFRRWCLQHDGRAVPLPVVLDGGFVPQFGGELPFVPAVPEIPTGPEFPTEPVFPLGRYINAYYGLGCVYQNRIFLGGLALFNDHSVAFYAGVPPAGEIGR
jgi:hypothetical protein